MALGSPAGSPGSRRRKIMAEINVTPLTDVFLVLLVIFMITTSAMVKPAADVDLPKTSEQEKETQGVMVTMTPSREIYVGDRPIPRDDASLVAALKDALGHSTEKIVILAGDRDVILGEVVRVLGLAKEAGSTGFALASE
jgi:biopolymer transport protein ExbD